MKRFDIPVVHKSKLLNQIEKYLGDKQDKAKLVELQKVYDAEVAYAAEIGEEKAE